MQSKDIELSFDARAYLGKLIGITDRRSPLLRTNEAFYDRVHVYEPYKYIGNLIETFDNERKQFKNDKEYIETLEKEDERLTNIIVNSVLGTDALLNEIFKDSDEVRQPYMLNRILHRDVYIDEYVDTEILEIKPQDSLFGVYTNYSAMVDHSIKTVDEFLKRNTDLQFLIERGTINREYIPDLYKEQMTYFERRFGETIFGKITKILNEHQLIGISGSSVHMSVSSCISIDTLNNIQNMIDSCDWLRKANVEFEIYKLRKPDKKSDLLIRECDSNIEFVKGHELDKIAYMRKQRQEEFTKNDLIFEVNGTYCKASKHRILN